MRRGWGEDSGYGVEVRRRVIFNDAAAVSLKNLFGVKKGNGLPTGWRRMGTAPTSRGVRSLM